MQDNEDYYKLLEVSPDATFQEIKAAYRVLCKEYHPDKMPPGTPEKARKYIEERFKQLNEAYSTL
ncbi:MAG: DnaJ family molecular chaperone, partial [Dolichospermum sp.]